MLLPILKHLYRHYLTGKHNQTQIFRHTFFKGLKILHNMKRRNCPYNGIHTPVIQIINQLTRK